MGKSSVKKKREHAIITAMKSRLKKEQKKEAEALLDPKRVQELLEEIKVPPLALLKEKK